MITEPLNIAKLVSKKFRDELTEHESLELQSWIKRDVWNEVFLFELEAELREGVDTRVFNEFDEQSAWTVIQKKRWKTKMAYWAKLVAVVVAVCSVSLLLFRINKNEYSSPIVKSEEAKFNNDVLPAIKGAKIVRGDGTELKVVDNVRLLDDGSITTDDQKIIAEAGTRINTLVVPAANFLNITLSDGTKVWVNASSELEFPSSFSDQERRVSLKGEAYFEVAKDSNRPFLVDSKGAEIRVLGTHFNISAYNSWPVTTLVEGKVEVSNSFNKEILTPGQQAEIGELAIVVRKADFLKNMAWKNNTFYFKGDNIVQIAKQLETWYDLEVSFSKGVSFSNTYSGEISRSANLSEVLKMLEFVSDLDFKIDNNRLLIKSSEA